MKNVREGHGFGRESPKEGKGRMKSEEGMTDGRGRGRGRRRGRRGRGEKITSNDEFVMRETNEDRRGKKERINGLERYKMNK